VGFLVKSTSHNSQHTMLHLHPHSNHALPMLYCWDAYTSATPHEGYHLLAKWGHAKSGGCFAFTSNIDGHWLRVLAEDQVHECHGAVTHLQCLHAAKKKKKDVQYWAAASGEMRGMSLPPWSVCSGDAVEVAVNCPGGVPGATCQWQPAIIAEDGCRFVTQTITRSTNMGNADKLTPISHNRMRMCYLQISALHCSAHAATVLSPLRCLRMPRCAG
jgi:hypothetical protein